MAVVKAVAVKVAVRAEGLVVRAGARVAPV